MLVVVCIVGCLARPSSLLRVSTEVAPTCPQDAALFDPSFQQPGKQCIDFAGLTDPLAGGPSMPRDPVGGDRLRERVGFARSARARRVSTPPWAHALCRPSSPAHVAPCASRCGALRWIAALLRTRRAQGITGRGRPPESTQALGFVGRCVGRWSLRRTSGPSDRRPSRCSPGELVCVCVLPTAMANAQTVRIQQDDSWRMEMAGRAVCDSTPKA